MTLMQLVDELARTLDTLETCEVADRSFHRLCAGHSLVVLQEHLHKEAYIETLDEIELDPDTASLYVIAYLESVRCALKGTQP